MDHYVGGPCNGYLDPSKGVDRFLIARLRRVPGSGTCTPLNLPFRVIDNIVEPACSQLGIILNDIWMLTP